MKIEGSGSDSGSISQRHGSADPDGSTPKCHGSATLEKLIEVTAEPSYIVSGTTRGRLVFDWLENPFNAHAQVLYFGSPAARRAQQDRVPRQGRIHHNIPRLTHSIEESNTGNNSQSDLKKLFLTGSVCYL